MTVWDQVSSHGFGGDVWNLNGKIASPPSKFRWCEQKPYGRMRISDWLVGAVAAEILAGFLRLDAPRPVAVLTGRLT